jgi:hypothetical protein
MEISLRFYIQNYIATKDQQKIIIDKLNKYAFENTEDQQKIIIDKLNKYAFENTQYLDYYNNFNEKNPPKLFDTGIYDNECKMRCILSSEPRENRSLRLLGDATIQNTYIGVYSRGC